MNQIAKESWINPKVDINHSKLGGQGMFALRNISKGETILVWGGEYVSKEIADLAKKEHKLVMQWDENIFSIEDKGSDKAYYINHSCKPNVWMEDFHTLVAKEDIIIGEELTADYAMWEADESYVSKWDCLCSTSHCRGKVTGKDWELATLQTTYKSHFSPLVNKRIAAHVTLPD